MAANAAHCSGVGSGGSPGGGGGSAATNAAICSGDGGGGSPGSPGVGAGNAAAAANAAESPLKSGGGIDCAMAAAAGIEASEFCNWLNRFWPLLVYAAYRIRSPASTAAEVTPAETSPIAGPPMAAPSWEAAALFWASTTACQSTGCCGGSGGRLGAGGCWNAGNWEKLPPPLGAPSKLSVEKPEPVGRPLEEDPDEASTEPAENSAEASAGRAAASAAVVVVGATVVVCGGALVRGLSAAVWSSDLLENTTTNAPIRARTVASAPAAAIAARRRDFSFAAATAIGSADSTGSETSVSMRPSRSSTQSVNDPLAHLQNGGMHSAMP